MSKDHSPTIVDQLNGARSLSIASEGASVTLTLTEGDQTIAQLGRVALYDLRSAFDSGATILPMISKTQIGYRMHLDADTIKFSKDGTEFARFKASEVRDAVLPCEDSD